MLKAFLILYCLTTVSVLAEPKSLSEIKVDPSVLDTSKWKTFTSDFGWSIKYPSAFIISHIGTVKKFLKNQRENNFHILKCYEEAGFCPNVTVSLEDPNEIYNFTGIKSQMDTWFTNNSKNYKVLEDGDLQIAGIEAHERFGYFASFPNEGRPVWFIGIKHDNIVITFDFEEFYDKKKFKAEILPTKKDLKYFPVFEKMLEGFKFVPAKTTFELENKKYLKKAKEKSKKK